MSKVGGGRYCLVPVRSSSLIENRREPVVRKSYSPLPSTINFTLLADFMKNIKTTQHSISVIPFVERHRYSVSLLLAGRVNLVSKSNETNSVQVRVNTRDESYWLLLVKCEKLTKPREGLYCTDGGEHKEWRKIVRRLQSYRCYLDWPGRPFRGYSVQGLDRWSQLPHTKYFKF